MPLIKAQQAPTAVSAFSMADVEAHAAQLLARARSQAERLLTDAQAEAERIRGERYREGFEQGHREGLAKGMEDGKSNAYQGALQAHSKQLEALATALADSAIQLEASRRRLESETVYDVVRLAVAIARRVTKVFGEIEPQVARANVAEALRMVVNASAVKVALHPNDLALLERDLPAIRAMFPKLEQLELVGDGSLSPGGCRLLTGSGIVDADLDTQLDRIVADLLPSGAIAPH